MIVAHFFVRKKRKKPYLFVETTSSNGIEQPAPLAMMLMPLEGEDRKKWTRDAFYEFSRRYPDLTLIDSMDNYLRLESAHPSFDMVFKPKKRWKKTSNSVPDVVESGHGNEQSGGAPANEGVPENRQEDVPSGGNEGSGPQAGTDRQGDSETGP